jgi:hypothetical protein
MLDDCRLRGWSPRDCQSILGDDTYIRDRIFVALFKVAEAGRQAGGADPPESFQVYITSYITFFNETNPECNDVSWSNLPVPLKLTTTLRIIFNGLVARVNQLIQDAAQELETMGIIYVDGLERAYDGHRYCEPGHTSQQMIDYETWFWSPFADDITTCSNGPGDPEPDCQTPWQNVTVLQRGFHPKGVGYEQQKALFMAAIAENRDPPSSSRSSFVNNDL